MSSGGEKKLQFPIIGLGASAGGLEALREFFGSVEPDTGMAFVVIMHLSPDQSSAIPQLLGNVSKIPVAAAEHDQEVEPNQVYVIPPGAGIELYEGRLHLQEFHRAGKPSAIDTFLGSLAEDRGSLAGAVVLSGAGTDGSNGIKKIKAKEGVVLVQSAESAEYSSMPRSALATGVVDLAVDPSEMVAKLARHFSRDSESEAAEPGEEKALDKACALLREKLGHDFSGHKESTLRRRLLRRMALHDIDDTESYLNLLRENKQEAQALFKEFLIGVTHFFRDPEAFSALSESVLPQMIRELPEDEPFRAWVAGCSTGEEAFTVAILVREALESEGKSSPLQIFATDLDEQAIEIARAGSYPLSIATDISEKRLKRFFLKEGNQYRLRKEVRDSVVFSVQDLLSDPPFSRLHLLTCRNVLIYLKPQAQKKLLPLFHYTLKQAGVLLLGTSESIGGYTTLFEVVDQKRKIFRRKDVPATVRGPVQFPTSAKSNADGNSTSGNDQSDKPFETMPFLTQQLLLDEFGPDAVLVEGDGSIVFIQGKTGRYLEAVTGPPSSSILDLARPGLRLELASALRTAKTKEERVVRSGVTVQTEGGRVPVDLHVVPVKAPSRLAGRFLVVFKEPVSDEGADRGEEKESPDTEKEREARIGELEGELRKTQESHQSTVEELESANEELKSTNEELQSANEELQSTNEEHESSKEELQSLNEELHTTNTELEHKIGELQAANDDIRNLFNSIEVASIFLDGDLKVRRFTEEAKRIVNLIDTDVGRPLSDLVSNLDYEGLQHDASAAMESLETRNREVRTSSGVWYKMRVFPYRTSDNKIDGAVLTFVNIDDQKRAQQQLEETKSEAERTWALFRSVFNMNPQPLTVLDKTGRMVFVNDAFAEAADTEGEALSGIEFETLAKRKEDRKNLSEALHEALRTEKEFRLDPIGFGGGNKKRRAVRGTVIRQDETLPYRVLIRLEDAKDG